MTGGNHHDGGDAVETGPEGPSGRIGKVERYRVGTDADSQVWEVFQRDDDGRPMRHVGRVRAADAEAAHAHASRLFAWYAPEVWVCPARAVARFSSAGGPDDDPATPPSGDEPRTVEF